MQRVGLGLGPALFGLLLPVVLYPVMGILSTRETAPIYMNSTILLFLGGFMIAGAMQKWGLHRPHRARHHCRRRRRSGSL